MYVTELLSLTAGVLCMAAPFAQAIKTITTRNVAGLSVSSYMLLVPLGVLAVLIGVQYRIYVFMGLNAAICLCNACILFLISWRRFLTLIAAAIFLVILTALFAPWFLEGIVTTRWAESTAFVQGLLGASAFLPQVLLTRRTQSVSALSLTNLVLFTSGMIVAIALAVVLRNWAMLFWNGIIFLFMPDLLRLKIAIEYFPKQAQTIPEG